MRLKMQNPTAAGRQSTNAVKKFQIGMIAAASVVCLSALQLSAQQSQEIPGTPDATQPGVPVNGFDTAPSELDLPVGHSTVLQSAGPLATIIVGDNAVASAALGPGESIILTGHGVGATNVIILGDEGEVLMSTQVDVVPATQDLTSTVIVRGGATMRQFFDCRGSSGCRPIVSELGLTEAPRVTNMDGTAETSAGAAEPSE